MILRDILDNASEPELNTGCRLWSGQTTNGGYGRTSLCGQVVLVHRLSWELANGPITDNLHVLHKCDTPACINPNHHFLGTSGDNTDDYWRKRGLDPSLREKRKERDWLAGFDQRPRKYVKTCTKSKAGRRVGRHGVNRALTLEDVYAIRESGDLGTTLADRFGVTTGTISKIRNRRLWANLPERKPTSAEILSHYD